MIRQTWRLLLSILIPSWSLPAHGCRNQATPSLRTSSMTLSQIEDALCNHQYRQRFSSFKMVLKHCPDMTRLVSIGDVWILNCCSKFTLTVYGYDVTHLNDGNVECHVTMINLSAAHNMCTGKLKCWSCKNAIIITELLAKSNYCVRTRWRKILRLLGHSSYTVAHSATGKMAVFQAPWLESLEVDCDDMEIRSQCLKTRIAMSGQVEENWSTRALYYIGDV